MERIRQNMSGFRMPGYVEEILTQNYCRNFMNMSIIRDKGTYSFSYKPGCYTRIDASEMTLYDKLLLLRNLISMSENAADHLIRPESYLLEPELVYTKSGRVDNESLKLMYYPDMKQLDFRYKLVLFADRILNKNNKEEREIADRLREAAEPGDVNRIKLFLDKNILRLEGRMNEGKQSKGLRS